MTGEEEKYDPTDALLLVHTVMKPWLLSGESENPRASPKSQIWKWRLGIRRLVYQRIFAIITTKPTFNSQSAFTSKFPER